MSEIIKALEISLRLSKMNITDLLMAKRSTDNPKFINILDTVIKSKLPK